MKKRERNDAAPKQILSSNVHGSDVAMEEMDKNEPIRGQSQSSWRTMYKGVPPRQLLPEEPIKECTPLPKQGVFALLSSRIW